MTHTKNMSKSYAEQAREAEFGEVMEKLKFHLVDTADDFTHKTMSHVEA